MSAADHQHAPWETLEGRRIIVTGATGFVGRHLVPTLIEEGAHVHGADTHGHDVFRDPQYHHTVCDIRRPADCQGLMSIAEPDAVIHLAAQSHVPSAWENPERTWRINVIGTLNILRACQAQRTPPRMLFVSSGEVYGKPERLPLTEDHPIRPQNPYAATKAAAEVMVRQMADAGQVPAIIVRPFNHTGPGQEPRFAAPAFAEQVAKIEAGLQGPILQVGDLTPERDFLDVRDVCDAYLDTLCEGRIGETYNIASGTPCSIQTLLEGLLEQTDANIVVETDPERLRPVEVPRIVGDASRLRSAIGWQPSIPLEKTLGDLLAYFRLRLKSAV